MKVLQLNHVALHVADVAVSESFYRDVLQLEQLARPAFDFPGAWFRFGRRPGIALDRRSRRFGQLGQPWKPLGADGRRS